MVCSNAPYKKQTLQKCLFIWLFKRWDASLFPQSQHKLPGTHDPRSPVNTDTIWESSNEVEEEAGETAVSLACWVCQFSCFVLPLEERMFLIILHGNGPARVECGLNASVLVWLTCILVRACGGLFPPGWPCEPLFPWGKLLDILDTNRFLQDL